MAGVGGFEPPHGGIKIRCLTAWLHPKTILTGITLSEENSYDVLFTLNTRFCKELFAKSCQKSVSETTFTNVFPLSYFKALRHNCPQQTS